jgi:hypothetical protein
MRTTIGAIVLAALVLGAAAAGRAHHGWSGYDSARPLTIVGVILESGYEHPHGFVRLESPDKVWLVVLAPPSRMERRGLPKELLATGTTVSVHGYPHRQIGEEMRAERITINGKTVELR